MPLATAAERAEVASPFKRQFAYGNRAGEFLLLGIVVPATLAAIWLSWRWPMVVDGPLFQYGAFLMDHGKVLYRDLFEMNFPGAYFSSWLELHFLGYSDLAWRLYDLLFLLLGSVGIAFICKPFGRLATILSPCLLFLTHIRLGPGEIGERDFQMVVLELLSAGFMLQGFRDGKRRWFLASGAIAVVGTTIKPPGFLFLTAFLVQAIVVSRLQKEKKLAQPLWMVLGAALPCLLVVAYLLWNGAWWPFVEVCRKLIPLYASIRRQPWSFMRFELDSYLEVLRLLVVPSGLLLVCKAKTWLSRESATVALGAVCGFAGYMIQGKGFFDHLDPLIAFLTVWCGLSIATLMRDDRALVRLPLAIILAFWVLSWVPRFIYVPAAYRRASPDAFDIAQVHRLEAQIASLRASGNDKGIQVMDMTMGGVHALYDLRLVQSSEFINDIYFYNPPGHPFALDLRVRFLRKMLATRPDLLVISSQSWPNLAVRYKRLEQWPELQNFLQSNYELRVELPDFRIYVHR